MNDPVEFATFNGAGMKIPFIIADKFVPIQAGTNNSILSARLHMIRITTGYYRNSLTLKKENFIRYFCNCV